jgi:hypothetical protein
MHFCAFWLLPKFNTRCNVNQMFAKSLFSEICTQKAHFAQLGAVLGSIRRAGRCCGRGAPFYTSLPKSNGFESRIKVETLPKSKGHPLPESRMILREKISGKVKLGLYYVLLFHDSGIYPVFLTISHEDLFHVEGYFLIMTAWRFVCPALFSSLCLWFPRFSGFALAFTRHFRADFRLYYGI